MAADPDLLPRALDAIALLDAILADRGVLAALPDDVRLRLTMAAGRVSRPDRSAIREFDRAVRKNERDARRAEDEARRAATGIRVLRSKPVFENRLLPSDPEAADPRLTVADAASGDVGAQVGPAASADSATIPGEVPGSSPGTVHDERICYVCKGRFRELHAFYDQLCPECADLNWKKRNQTADLRGRVAIVTGARVKIGYYAALILLRAGAEVHVTTRFPKDAADRYAREPDFAAFADRLHVHGLDLRHIPSVEAFCDGLVARLPRLDFLINNACQTVRRPPGFYGHLLEREATPLAALPEAVRDRLALHAELVGEHAAPDGTLALPADWRRDTVGLSAAPALSQLALLPGDDERTAFPEGHLDADLQQVDLRDRNSWRLRLAEVPTVELLEVQLVNSISPFLLNARLKPLFLRVPARDKHIVNVSAMEGQFYRRYKTDKHPHTNMAKAALNMLTRTSAADYERDGIFMNSVDTGWITDEDPAEVAARKAAEQRFSPPLDVVDGAARIVDPILHGINTGEHVWGRFLKDYRPVDW